MRIPLLLRISLLSMAIYSPLQAQAQPNDTTISAATPNVINDLASPVEAGTTYNPGDVVRTLTYYGPWVLNCLAVQSTHKYACSVVQTISLERGAINVTLGQGPALTSQEADAASPRNLLIVDAPANSDPGHGVRLVVQTTKSKVATLTATLLSSVAKSCNEKDECTLIKTIPFTHCTAAQCRAIASIDDFISWVLFKTPDVAILFNVDGKWTGGLTTNAYLTEALNGGQEHGQGPAKSNRYLVSNPKRNSSKRDNEIMLLPGAAE